MLAGTAALLAASRLATPALLRAREEAEKDGPLVVTEIEVHEIMVPWDDVVAYEMSHFHGPTRRAIYVVHTNRGFIGLGEGEGPESAESLSRFIGSNPFDWVADETSLALGTAMYDLMGQAAGVPCYKLIGPRQRAWVPVACWTVSTHPRRMANAVREYSKRGYTWLKYHLSPFENVLDQLEAMQAVAPKGFRVHLDLTMGGTDDHPYELLENITKYPIVGCIEDPKGEADIEGYAELRKRCRVPIYYHHSPLGGTFETQRRAADGYILGNGPIGSTIWRAGLYDALQLPFSIQHTGGNITRAMTAHLHAAFRAASLHFNNDTESWSEDVVKERLEPVNGLLRVSEKPGLGLTLDRDKLAKLKALKLPEQPQWIIKTRYANGSVMYNLADPKSPIFMVRPDGRKLAPFSYAAPLSTEYWDPDGTPAFDAMMTRLQKEGMVLERG
jgi:L-alanine-DL-glutamate epimerase-like enolase superfamily enzyme